MLRSLDAFSGFLLEGMYNPKIIMDLHRINCSKRISAIP